MAASKDKAQALKNSYVDGIIDELGGASDPAVRMAIREGDQASVHAFPEQGKMGAINDGDPNFYVHGEKGDSYNVDRSPDYANPVPYGNGGRFLMDGTKEDIDNMQYYLDQERNKMGGSGDLARLGPRTLEEFNRRHPDNRPPEKRTIQRRDRSSAGGFDSSNLAGAMGMEQGNTASVIMKRQGMQGVNDGDPTMYLYDSVYGKYHEIDRNPQYANPGNGFAPYRSPREHMMYDKARQDATFRSWDKQIYGR